MVAGLAIAGAASRLPAPRPPVLTDRDSLVLADFDNKTGEAVFDRTLRQALAIQLEQSPYLLIHPDARVRQVLTLMGRSPDERLTSLLAREVCQREDIKAVLSGAISSLGQGYVISLEATNCDTGDVLVREQAQAGAREEVLEVQAAPPDPLRRKLGESLVTIQKFGRPIQEVTTSSLEAFKAAAMATEEYNREGPSAALPFFRRAVELDPDFAMAHAWLGQQYATLGPEDLAQKHMNKAFELKRAHDRA